MLRRFRKLDTLTQAIIIAGLLLGYGFLSEGVNTVQQLPQAAQEIQRQQQDTGETFHDTLKRIAEP